MGYYLTLTSTLQVVFDLAFFKNFFYLIVLFPNVQYYMFSYVIVKAMTIT